mmetsp:Transcript_18970/g.75646  ORF Transcript_18970/g.75646 Transcript_18970/m.75646 type:complete len:1016 (+) Transcript_18970:33-3080(+)
MASTTQGAPGGEAAVPPPTTTTAMSTPIPHGSWCRADLDFGQAQYVVLSRRAAREALNTPPAGGTPESGTGSDDEEPKPCETAAAAAVPRAGAVEALVELLAAYIPNVNGRELLASGDYEGIAYAVPLKERPTAYAVVAGCAYRPHKATQRRGSESRRRAAPKKPVAPQAPPQTPVPQREPATETPPPPPDARRRSTRQRPQCAAAAGPSSPSREEEEEEEEDARRSPPTFANDTAINFVELALFCVHASCQQKGHGSALMGRLERRALEPSIDAGALFAYADVDAFPFFKRMGFSRTIRTPFWQWKSKIRTYNSALVVERPLTGPHVYGWVPTSPPPGGQQPQQQEHQPDEADAPGTTTTTPPTPRASSDDGVNQGLIAATVPLRRKKKVIPCSTGRPNCYCKSKRTRAIEEYDPTTMATVRTFCSAASACETYGLAACAVAHVCNGYSFESRGRYFRYAIDLPYNVGGKSQVVEIDPAKSRGRRLVVIGQVYDSARAAANAVFGPSNGEHQQLGGRRRRRRRRQPPSKQSSYLNGAIGECANGFVDRVRGRAFRWWDPKVPPCHLCGTDAGSSALLLCDGMDARCDAAAHARCLGLETAPKTSWYCPSCDDRRRRGWDMRACVPRTANEPRGFPDSDDDSDDETTAKKKKKKTASSSSTGTRDRRSPAAAPAQGTPTKAAPKKRPQPKELKALVVRVKRPPAPSRQAPLRTPAGASSTPPAFQKRGREADDDARSPGFAERFDDRDEDDASTTSPRRVKRPRRLVDAHNEATQNTSTATPRQDDAAGRDKVVDEKPEPSQESNPDRRGGDDVARRTTTTTDALQRLRILQANPKKVGSKSHARYEGYKAATTVEEYLRLGGSRADLKHDRKRGFVTLLPGGDQAPEAKEDPVAAAPPSAQTTPRVVEGSPSDEEDAASSAAAVSTAGSAPDPLVRAVTATSEDEGGRAPEADNDDAFWQPVGAACRVRHLDQWYAGTVFEYTDECCVIKYDRFKGHAALVNLNTDKTCVQWCE